MIDPTIVSIPVAGEVDRGWLIALISGGITLVTTLGSVWLRRKRPKSGAEDAVYETSQLTILDLRAENKALRAENDTLRVGRNEAEAALAQAQAQAKIAAQAAETASAAAKLATHELETIRARWVAKLQYIHTLKSTLALHGIEIPPEPT